jgi:hypothetical protein
MSDPVKWLRLARRLLIVGRLPLNLEDHLFDVLGNLIVHVRHRTPSQGHIRLGANRGNNAPCLRPFGFDPTVGLTCS